MKLLIGVALAASGVVLFVAAISAFTATAPIAKWHKILGSIGFFGGWTVSLAVGFAVLWSHYLPKRK